jgi:hypothetical protein
MSGWTVVDTATNKSLPVGGSQNSGTGVPYITPAPSATDPVGKFRVSTPQSLIDTDFEYGTQPTKWESIALQNNRQSTYYIPQSPLPISAITGTATADQVTITTSISISIPNNTPIYIQNSTNSTINQWGGIVTGGTGTSFTVNFAPGTTTTVNAAQYFSATSCYVYQGYFYTGAGFQVGANPVVVTSATVLTITTTNAHGLSKGSLIYLNGAALGGGATNVNGSYVVATVPTYNTFTVTASGASGTPTYAGGNGLLYARSSGFVEPRSFDGGVAFSSGSAVPNQQLVRQTRRYFRYQSGKGLQFSTGSSLKPALFVTSVVNASGTVTVTTRFNHNLAVGAQIQVIGCDQGYFNGNYSVVSVATPTTFTYTISTSNTVTATGLYRITPLSWYGSFSRIGFFDNQNGMFFEYDGQILYTVLRNSTNQINGTVSVTNNSNIVTGNGTQFTTQLQPGSYIVIRGQSYRVVQIDSATSMQITPEYRGVTIANAIVSITIDTKTPQSQWLDPCNGTGASGYNIDLTRMQMWYIDYSWYGAGYIRFGVRGTNGLITYVNQIQNNNKQFEAYMRSGNMAAHYEVTGIGPSTYITSDLSGGTTTISANVLSLSDTIPVASTAVFNATGGVAKMANEYIFYSGLSTTTGAGNLLNCVRGYGSTAADDQASGTTIAPSSFYIANASGCPTSALTAGGAQLQFKVSATSSNTEYINYTGITPTNLVWGLTRAQTGGQASAQSFTAGVGTAVELSTPDSVPALSHWGSSAIMDGLFNDDKSLIFNYGTPALTTTTLTTQITPILAIRIAPSVDNGQTGLLGVKEIINRMQLQLFELGIYATGPLLVNLILNGYTTGTFTGSFGPPITQGVGAYTSSLAQVASNTTNSVTLVGGESVAAAFTNSNGQTTLDLSQVRDLGNSILGGGTTNVVPTAYSGVYPDGPDILYVCVTPLTATAITVNARLSWKEAQA